jgi:hypothetical protein
VTYHTFNKTKAQREMELKTKKSLSASKQVLFSIASYFEILQYNERYTLTAFANMKTGSERVKDRGGQKNSM